MLQMKHFTSFFLKFKSSVLVKRFFFLLNAAFAMAIVDLISQVHLPSFVKMLPKYLKRFTFSSCFWSTKLLLGIVVLKFSLLLFFPHSFSWHGFFLFQIHTYIHTYMHTYIPTYIHAYVHTYIHIHTYWATYVHAYILTYIHPYIQI